MQHIEGELKIGTLCVIRGENDYLGICKTYPQDFLGTIFKSLAYFQNSVILPV